MNERFQYVSLGKGPQILRYSGLFALALAILLPKVRYINKLVIFLGVFGLLTSFFSYYYSNIKKEKNTLFGVSTWVYGIILLILALIIGVFV